MAIQKPEINPTFFFGPIVSYQLNGDVSKDKGKYRIRFTLYFKSGDTYSTQKSGFKTEAEARKARDLLIADLVRNEYIPFDYTVKELFDYWLYHHMIVENKIRYNTFQSYRNVLYNHLLPVLGESKRLSKIIIEDIETTILQIPYPSVKNRGVKVARLVFDFAFANHYISFNPSIAAVEKIKNSIPKQKKREVVPYTLNQVKLLLYTCKENFHDLYLPLLLSLTIGTRISETIGLKYEDVDFTAQTIYIRRQLGRNITDTDGQNLVTQKLDTKTPNGVRAIPVPDWVIDELLVKRAWYERQKKLVPDFQDNDYILCHCNGRPFNRSSFGRDFHKLTCMCGLPETHWHDLRHMYATVLKNNKVNMKAVSEFLGHHSSDFTENAYIYQDEVAYDCTILTEVWENCRPKSRAGLGLDVLNVPLYNEDYVSLFT
ncbi:MAG TPA: site-specific integrase [Methanocorpusculum sp.]|nr:site-specific integrase [Methanocorpusculum sp.]